MATDHNEGLSYTTVEGFISWVSSNFAGILANDNVNDYSVDGDKEKGTIAEALLFGEGEVDGYLNKRGFKTPVPDRFPRTHNVLKIYVYNIASYELFGRTGITKERYYKYTRVMQNLDRIGNGEKHLPEKIEKVSKGEVVSGNNSDSIFNNTNRNGRYRI